MKQLGGTLRNGRSSWRRAAIWLVAATAGLMILYRGADLYAESYIRKQLDRAAASVCATVYADPGPSIGVDLLDRRVTITGLTFLQNAPCSGGSMNVVGHLDTLDIRGISIAGLLFRHRLSVNVLQVTSSRVIVRMMPDSLRSVAGKEVGGEVPEPWSVAVGSFAIHLDSSAFITAEQDTVSTLGDGIRAHGRNFTSVPGSEDASMAQRVEQLVVTSDSVTAQLASGYGISLGHAALDQQRRTLDLGSVKAMPRAGSEAFSAGLQYETDVIEARMDTIAMSGFDLNASLSSGALSTSVVRLRNGAVVVLRDKTLPDGPSVEVPLLGELIRRFPDGAGVDTILVHGLDVLYREQADAARGYAEVPFGQIEATISGVRNIQGNSSAFVIDARCNAFTDVPVSMTLRMMVQDTTDRFELNAAIGTMPFASLNKVTGPLMDIRSPEGVIDTVIMHMDADVDHANGLVQLAYHDLKLSSGGRKRKETMNQLETLLLNTLVKKDNRNSGGPRQGYFSFDRRRDRAIFNYMWSGLREGTKEILLPKALTQ